MARAETSCRISESHSSRLGCCPRTPPAAVRARRKTCLPMAPRFETVRASHRHTRRCPPRYFGVATSALLVALACASGCVSLRRTFTPAVDPATLDDVTFLHYLATVPVATVDEGRRAVLMLRDNDGPQTPESRRDRLIDLGAIKETWSLAPDQILDKGTLAYMLRTLCDMPRGLNETLAIRTGLGDRRYAVRTCAHEGVLSYGLPHEPVTGGELVAAIAKADEYLEAKTRPDG